MPVVSDVVPSELQADVDAALAWFNDSQEVPFEVTGIVDPERSIDSGNPRTLRLVLCGGDSCQKHEFEVETTGDGYRVAFFSEAAEAGINADDATPLQAELDPPPGALRNWLDSIVPKHSFTLLLFYRGFW